MFPFNDAFYGEASLMRQTWRKRWEWNRTLSNSQVTFLVAEIIGGWGPPSWHTELLSLYVAAICRECFYCVKSSENEYVKLKPAVIQQGFLECHHRRGWAPWKGTLTDEWLWGRQLRAQSTSVARSGMVGWPAGAFPEFWAPINLSNIDLCCEITVLS